MENQPIYAVQTLKVSEQVTILRAPGGDLFVTHPGVTNPVKIEAHLIERLCLKVIREQVGL